MTPNMTLNLYQNMNSDYVVELDETEKKRCHENEKENISNM